jgi:hypothetical protein
MEPTENHDLARGRTIRNINIIFKMKIMIHVSYYIYIQSSSRFQERKQNEITSEFKNIGILSKPQANHRV